MKRDSKMIWIGLFCLYVTLGVIKLRYFDRNQDADWLMMLADKRNRRCHVAWFYVMLLVAYLSWPIALFTKKVSLAKVFFQFQWRHFR